MKTSGSANTRCATPASTISWPPTRNTPAASAGAPSTTTRTATSAPATASAITASPISSASPSRPPASTSRSAIRARGGAGAGVPLGARRRVHRLHQSRGLLQLRPPEALHRRKGGRGGGPQQEEFPPLRYAPFGGEPREIVQQRGALGLGGYIQGKQVSGKKFPVRASIRNSLFCPTTLA